jgi:hypothetical protein
MHRHDRAPTDLPVLEPLAPLGRDVPWTAATTRARRSPPDPRRPVLLEAIAPAPAAVGPDEGPARRGVVQRAGAAAAAVGRWLEADLGPGPVVVDGAPARSTTDGWPHHGSTVVRLVRTPSERVAHVVGSRTRWDGLRLRGGEPGRIPVDGGWCHPGRLAVGLLVRAVRVELRITPCARDRTWAHLVLVSRARWPRRYWARGHAALAAIDAASRDSPSVARSTTAAVEGTAGAAGAAGSVASAGAGALGGVSSQL